LRRLKRDPTLRGSLAAGGRRFAERYHDLDLVGRKYELVFDAILSER
jgi:hypothetical protein